MKRSEPDTVADCKDAARFAGLHYVSTGDPGIRRRRAGRGFCYSGLDGKMITDRELLSRIKALAIPPAWTSVWICPDDGGHLQAFGYDAKGRKQYLYHPGFRALRDEAQFEHMISFAEALPGLRRRISEAMAESGLGRGKVLATVVHLLETTMIRVGNGAYAKENKSYGLTTLLNRHVEIDCAELRFQFAGKGAKFGVCAYMTGASLRSLEAVRTCPASAFFNIWTRAGSSIKSPHKMSTPI